MSGKEGLTIYAHLGPRETDEVAVRLIHEGLWNGDGMVYDCDAGLLMTTTNQAKEVIMTVLEKLDLLPRGRNSSPQRRSLTNVLPTSK